MEAVRIWQSAGCFNIVLSGYDERDLRTFISSVDYLMWCHNQVNSAKVLQSATGLKSPVRQTAAVSSSVSRFPTATWGGLTRIRPRVNIFESFGHLQALKTAGA